MQSKGCHKGDCQATSRRVCFTKRGNAWLKAHKMAFSNPREVYNTWPEAAKEAEITPPASAVTTGLFRPSTPIETHRNNNSTEPYLLHSFTQAQQETAILLWHNSLMHSGTKATQLPQPLHRPWTRDITWRHLAAMYSPLVKATVQRRTWLSLQYAK